MKKNIKLSTLVVAHNEEKILSSCLKKLKYSDELVVVLDRTTDNSKIIAKEYEAKVYEGSWKIEAERRNFGIKMCKGDWILEIDADEHVPKELFLEIRKVIEHSVPGYYLIPFDNYIGSKRVRYGWGASWGVSAAPRLFYKGCKVWSPKQSIHPSILLKGKKKWLKTRINHYVDDNINDMLMRLIRYTDLKSADLASSKKKLPPFYVTLRRGITRFFKCYISRKGYKEGRWGFIIATMASLYIIISYVKAQIIREK
ncbi:glycosyltransferase family 2 protein [Alphaproteobacteria bacterium]|nr:glycosyltransferase family 2 protein [Alphaproteobacteria bacterium]